MSWKKHLDIINNNISKYTVKETGTYYNLKDKQYKPCDPNPNNPEGRYNGSGTASLYFANTVEGCIEEVGTENKKAYKVDFNNIKLDKVLDLKAFSEDNPSHSGSLLMESGSGGYEPTRKISDFAYDKGFKGIRFISQHGSSYTNLMLFTDRVEIDEINFSEINLDDYVLEKG